MDYAFAATLGTLMGLFSGLIPGAGNLVTMLLFFPLLLQLDPYQLLIMYACLVSISQFIGSVPAVLAGIPGESSSIPAVIVGHSMNKSGNGSLAIMSCAIGSSFGTVVTVLVTFLMFSHISWIFDFYYNWVQLTIFTIMFFMILFTSANSKFVNLVYILLGLLLGTIGYDHVLGTEVLSFGNLYLFSGLPFFIVALGLIAIPEIAKVNFESTVPDTKSANNNTLVNLRMIWKSRTTILWSSFVGYFGGLVPGLTSTFASNASYTISEWTNRLRKTPRLKGQVNSILAAETSNNVAAFTQLIPLIFLGIPILGSEALILALAEMKGFSFTATESVYLLTIASVAVLCTNIFGVILSWPLSTFIMKIYTFNRYFLNVSLAWILAIIIYMGIQDYSVVYYLVVFFVSTALGLLLRNTDRLPILIFFLLQNNIFQSINVVSRLYF